MHSTGTKSIVQKISTVKPRNSGLLQHQKIFHYYGVFHYFDGSFSRKGHFDHSGVVHYFAGFHYFAVHYCGVLLYLQLLPFAKGRQLSIAHATLNDKILARLTVLEKSVLKSSHIGQSDV